MIEVEVVVRSWEVDLKAEGAIELMGNELQRNMLGLMRVEFMDIQLQ